MLNMPSEALSTFAHKALLVAVFLAAVISDATAQGFLFGQAGLQTGTTPSGIAVADFNSDGRPDLAFSNQGDNSVSVVLATSTGTFAA
jgi:hypothetical protein